MTFVPNRVAHGSSSRGTLTDKKADDLIEAYSNLARDAWPAGASVAPALVQPDAMEQRD
jgi:hypothetical protein